MATWYDVKQGDDLASIAADFGFASVHAIWDAPENSSLHDQKREEMVLQPGDQVYVPDTSPKAVSGETGKRHQFRVLRPYSIFRLVVEDHFGVPRSQLKYELTIDKRSKSDDVKEDGLIEMKIDVYAKEGTLTLYEQADDRPIGTWSIDLGHLNPVDDGEGAQSRLSALGYYDGKIDGDLGPRSEEAVSSFQREHGLSITGDCDEKTQTKLKEVYSH